MKIYSTVEAAVDLAISVSEQVSMIENTNTLRNKIYSWYSNTDITDPEILAACALMGKSFIPGTTYTDMLNAKNIWFPEDSTNEFAIWDIEAAQCDALYW